MSQKKLPLRVGVGVIVLNSENKIFVGKRLDNPVDKWQMPQGGIDPGETPEEAAKMGVYKTMKLPQAVNVPDGIVCRTDNPEKRWKWLSYNICGFLVACISS